MAVVVSAVAAGFTAEMYETVTDRAMPGGELPDGCRLHLAGPVEQGWRVITVWESSKAFHRFREEKLVPAIREAGGGDGPPGVEPDVNPVHKLITA